MYDVVGFPRASFLCAKLHNNRRPARDLRAGLPQPFQMQLRQEQRRTLVWRRRAKQRGIDQEDRVSIVDVLKINVVEMCKYARNHICYFSPSLPVLLSFSILSLIIIYFAIRQSYRSIVLSVSLDSMPPCTGYIEEESVTTEATLSRRRTITYCID